MKAFNKDRTCRGLKYEEGSTYEIDGELVICKNGLSYKGNFIKAYLTASESDRLLVQSLPNFDAAVFFDISGIDVINGCHRED